MAVSFFVNLYSEEASRIQWPKKFPCIETEHMQNLSKNVSMKGKKDTVFAMGAYKAPGEDGYHAISNILERDRGLAGQDGAESFFRQGYP